MLAALLALAWGQPAAKFVPCSITAEGLVDVFIEGDKIHGVVPRLFVFDRDGRMTLNTSGYTSRTMDYVLRAINTHGDAKNVRMEVLTASLRTADGQPVDAAALRGTPTVVELGAAWCHPCHVLEQQLHRIPGITVLQVDADMRGRDAEVAAALKKRLAKQ